MITIRQLIVSFAPHNSREDMVANVSLQAALQRFHANAKRLCVKRHSIMDAFRRLKAECAIEECCDGTIREWEH